LRVRVKLPALGDKVEVWARLVTPDAGNQRGFYFRPEPDDEVVVGFFNNDPRSAIVLGSLFGARNRGPAAFGATTKENDKKGIVTRSGIVVGFVDGEKPSVLIETPGKNKVLLSDKDKCLSITDQHGNTIVLDDKGVTIQSHKDLNVECKGNLKLKATGSVAIEGQKVDVK
jgi:uncharacterized protein involved in type VI secretion and phage assembly